MPTQILQPRRKATHKPPLRAAEFFAGIGLVRLALEKHGWEIIFVNDIDPDKREMYDANFNCDRFHFGNVQA